MEIINSNKFSDIADVVFSEIIDYKKFNEKNINNNLRIIKKSKVKESEFVWYINDKFNLRNNDIIFCQTEILPQLFKILKKQKKLKNLILISHQSDKTVNNYLYSKKPKSIIAWFGTNVVTNKKDVKAIPIGVNNDYMYMYPIAEDFTNKNFKKYLEKKKLLYLNFNTNTRFLQRYHAKQFFRDTHYVIYDENILSKGEYLEKINNARFVLCPWGNGFDTHRLWESIYSNSIPIVVSHKAYESFKVLPIVFVNKFKNLNFEKINIENHDQNLNGTIADFGYWRSKITSLKTLENSDKNIHFDLKKENKQFLNYFNILRVINNRYKRVRYFFFRIYKYIIKLLN